MDSFPNFEPVHCYRVCTFTEGKESSTPKASWLQRRQTPPVLSGSRENYQPASWKNTAPSPRSVCPVWVILGSCLWQWPEFHARCFLGEQLEKEKLPGGLVTAPDDVVSAGSGHWFVLEMSCLWWSPVGTRQAGAFKDQQHSNWLISQSA